MKRILIIVLFCALQLKAHAEIKKNVVTQIKKSNYYNESYLYQKAEIELSKQNYTLYRIAERLIRANKLDEIPWRLYIPVNNGEFNATASERNLITIYPILYDSYAGNVSALAFIVGHEMAHNYLNHYSRLTKIVKTAQKSLNEEIENKQKRPDWLDPMSGHPQTQEIIQSKETKDEEILAITRQIEYEADKYALIYMLKAGFNPEKAIESLEFFYKDEHTLDNESTTHPITINRIHQIKILLKNLKLTELKNEGLINLKNSHALTYEKSLDKKSIRINSKYTNSEKPSDNFKELFGK